MRTFFLLLMLVSFKGLCQYPFEKYPAIPVISTPKLRTMVKNPFVDKEGLPDINKYPVFEYKFDNHKVRFVVEHINDFDSFYLYVYTNKKITQRIHLHDYLNYDHIVSAKTADFNGDGIRDFKLAVNRGGCGLAAFYTDVVYLFGNRNGTYTLVSYTDMEDEHFTERDFNHDGIAEIMTMEVVHHGGHNYRCYNIYNYIHGKMFCVNDAYNYPIMIQLLNRRNYSITKHLTRQQMKQYAKVQPGSLE